MAHLKRTPLHDNHTAQEAKMVDFGGWEMPVQYSGIVREHHAVRENAGIFDVSHMGEFEIKGRGALPFLDYITANDPKKLGIGRGQYSLFLNNDGGSIDDIIVYRTGKTSYLIVVNASNIDKDWAHVKNTAKEFEDLAVQNVSEDYALIALQGPHGQEVLQQFVDRDLSEIGFFRMRQARCSGCPVRIARTGYTGEGQNGFEIFTSPADASPVWEALLKDDRVTACGLGARDTLRIEASLPLYGHELDESTSPIEAGLDIFVSESPNFIGGKVIEQQRRNGPGKRLVMIEMTERGIPRQGYTILNSAGTKIGSVTSGTVAPWVDKIIAMGYVTSGDGEIGSKIAIEIRNRPVQGKIVTRPFFKR